MFLIAATIIGLAATAITVKTLVGYTAVSWWWRLFVLSVISFCWFGHSILSYCRHNGLLALPSYTVLSWCVYVGLGFGFILLVLILVRDFSWFASYGIAKMAKSGCCDRLNPFNSHYLNIANIITVIIAVLVTFCGVYAALKAPDVKTVTIADAKISSPLGIVQLSDLHINRTTPVSRIDNLVARVNGMTPDLIVITGDLVDEHPDAIENQMQALSRLKSKYGTFIVFGNHDFYSGMLPWLKRFSELKLMPLFNNGVALDNKIYLAGIPDKSIERMSRHIKIDLPEALKDNKKGLYTILLSHTPDFSEQPVGGFDLQLSGHTHGGQIFPFHLLVKAANKYLAGLYQEEGYKVYVSRGTGYWGPPVRLFAPSEITVFELKPAE